MTDDRNDPAGPPEPPAPPLAPSPPPPPPPPAPAPVAARPKPWGWIVAGLLTLVLIVLVVLYFMGVFDREQRREEIPWNEAAPSAATGDPMRPDPGVPQPPPAAPAMPAAGGTVTAAWLLGAWGQDCPADNDPDLTFLPGGRLLLGSSPGTWALSGDVVTVTRDGQPNTSVLRWEVLSQDSARVTQVRSGNVYSVYRCR